MTVNEIIAVVVMVTVVGLVLWDIHKNGIGEEDGNDHFY
jgi:hypothetical protein